MDLSHKRVLIVKPSSMGDVVHTLPVVHAIKRLHPSCHVGWIVQRTFQGIIDADPAVDEVIPIFIPSTSDPHAGRRALWKATKAVAGTLVALRKRFKANPYDLVLDLHASFRSGLIALTNPGGVRIGLADAKELNAWFQHQLVIPDPDKPHAVDKNLQFVTHLGCDPEPGDFVIRTSEESGNAVRAFLSEAGISDQDRLVYANPATRWETKYWTVQGWAALADLLISRAGIKVVFSGGPQDEAYIRQIVDKMSEPAVSAAGRLTLSEAIVLIGAADVYVGVDSGPMHIAAFAGTPVVALFGPTDPAKVGPYGQGHRVVQNPDVDCLACRKRSCDDRRCLEGIGPEQVFEETLSIIRGN
jgi:lipopolysaccharide heptosyltransferase I